MTDQKLPRLVKPDSDTFEFVEPNGDVSVRIFSKAKDYYDEYRIRHFTSTQEIYDKSGKTVARTSDPVMAEQIRCLLVIWEKHKKKLANEAKAD